MVDRHRAKWKQCILWIIINRSHTDYINIYESCDILRIHNKCENHKIEIVITIKSAIKNTLTTYVQVLRLGTCSTDVLWKCVVHWGSHVQTHANTRTRCPVIGHLAGPIWLWQAPVELVRYLWWFAFTPEPTTAAALPVSMVHVSRCCC